MQNVRSYFVAGFALGLIALAASAQAAAPVANNQGTPMATPKPIKPYRTFVTVQRYNVESTGEAANAIANVRLDLNFPTGQNTGVKVPLPAANQFWPIGQGQVQEINQTFEIPWALIKNDGFTFVVQMVRKGTKILPCQVDVKELSQFNRQYICRTDVNYQTSMERLKDSEVDKEAVQVRVFTDLNLQPKEKLPAEIAIVR